MMEYLEFLFLPFGRDVKVNSFDRLLNTLNEEDLVSYFPGISNHIANDIISAVSYLHNKNILHIDIKPSDIIVSNLHYSSREGSELTNFFSKEPIICKLGDLGESR